MKKKAGPPSLYNKALVAKICRPLAEGKRLRSICRDDAMPAISTVMRWLFDANHDEFSEQYARAREAQAEVRADEIVSIADDDTNDFTPDKDGKLVVDHEHIQRSRLRVDARKWIAAKLLPKPLRRQAATHGRGRRAGDLHHDAARREMTRQVVYNASPTLSRFHRSDAFVRAVRGPVGSGKSTAMSWEIMRRAREQKPAPNGKRRTRWAVVRNTYRELKDSL